MKKILVTDPIHPEAITLLQKSGFIVDVMTGLDKDRLKEILPGYQALICRTSTKITREILSSTEILQCIGVHATGVDHIDIEAANQQGIHVLGYPSKKETVLEDRNQGSFIPVAEYVLMAMLASAKKFIPAYSSMKSGEWEKYSLSGTELYGKTLGIIGLGRIGSLVAKRAQAFGMRVLAYHPTLTKEEANELGAELVSLDTLYRESNFITIHIPQTTQNIGFINSQSFRSMELQPVFINTARAGVVDDEALLEALNNGQIKTAVLDVFHNAPKGVNWRLVQHPKVIATPHIAGVSEESLERVSTHIANIVTDYLKYGKINGLINNPIK